MRRFLAAVSAFALLAGAAGAQTSSLSSGSTSGTGNTPTSQVQLQSGSATVGAISNTLFGATQSGPWSVGLGAGSNTIGAISNTAFGLTGSLPAGTNALGGVNVLNLPATQPVSGSVAVTNLPGTQTVTGTVQVGNLPALQPVSGTVTTGAGSTTTEANSAAVLAAMQQTLAQLKAGVAAAVPCAPVTATLGAAGQLVALPCPGAPGYIITVSGNLNGTLVSTDMGTGGGRRLMKTGAIPLDVSTLSYDGTQAGVREYRTTGGGDGQQIAVGAYTSGTMTVTIRSMPHPDQVFINGEAQTSERVALLNGRSYSVSGSGQVAPGNFLQLLLSNPAGSGVRLYVTHRIMGCDTSNAVAPKYYSIRNPTANLPPSAATVTNRGASTTPPLSTATYGVTSAAPTGTSTPLAIPLPASGPFNLDVETTVEPGTSLDMYIGGTTNSGGVGAVNATCGIVDAFEQLPIN